ncbi:MAG: hypothetical protein ACLSDO_00530 [Anaerotruncus colihominis]
MAMMAVTRAPPINLLKNCRTSILCIPSFRLRMLINPVYGEKTESQLVQAKPLYLQPKKPQAGANALPAASALAKKSTNYAGKNEILRYRNPTFAKIDEVCRPHQGKGEYCHERRKDLCKPRVLRVVLL